MIAIVNGAHLRFDAGFVGAGAAAGGGTRRSRMGVLEIWTGAGVVLMKKVTGNRLQGTAEKAIAKATANEATGHRPQENRGDRGQVTAE